MTLERPDSIAFDLDGTLWDTNETCARAWNHVVARHGIRYRSMTGDDVRRVAGKPHDQCMRESFVGLSEEEIAIIGRDTMVEDNAFIDREGGTLFEGVREGIIALAPHFRLFIVSNCQSGYIELFLKHSGVGHLISDFECWGNTRRSKPDNLRDVIQRNQLERPWFVGDTTGDLEAARACGAPFVFAGYGFGQVAEAELRIASFADLPRALGI